VPEPADPLWIFLVWLAFLISAFLALAAIGDGLVKAIKPAQRLDRRRAIRHAQRKTRDFIPFMTPKDREIVGYLLHYRQKMFSTNIDGGYAAPLIAKGIITRAMSQPQFVDALRMPFAIPDHIWAVLEENRDQFPYQPPSRGPGREAPPWADF